MTGDRDCNNCVYHTTGQCTKWECVGTITRQNLKEITCNEVMAEAINITTSVLGSTVITIEQLQGILDHILGVNNG